MSGRLAIHARRAAARLDHAERAIQHATLK
jgi:hypothetical protein